MNIATLDEIKPNPDIPTLSPGDTVKVSTRVVEGDKERTQVFQGVVIKVRNRGAGSSFTVRRVTYGVGVERTFPLYSPRVEKAEIVRRGKVRRAKLYYLRGLSAKTSRLKERRLSPKELEREREEARILKERQELEKEQAQARKLEQEELAATEQEEAVLEQEPVVAEQEDTPVLEQEPVVAEQEDTPVLEQEPAIAEQEDAPELEQKPEQEEEKE